jgi:hypothetical protein
MFGCSSQNSFKTIIQKHWDTCKSEDFCTINLANSFTINWDTLCYYSGALSLEEINRDLGIELKDFTDIGDRIILLNKGQIVYHWSWFYEPSEQPSGVIIETNLKKFKISKQEALFKIKKNGKMLVLTRII